MKINLDAVKSRLGSISKTKLETLPNGIQTLLATDFPNILKELEAAREVCDEARKLLKDWVGNGYPLALGIALDKARQG